MDALEKLPKHVSVNLPVWGEGEDDALLIFSIQDIYELPLEEQPKRRPLQTMRHLTVPKAKGYSKKWKGKWITRHEITQRYWVSRYLTGSVGTCSDGPAVYPRAG